MKLLILTQYFPPEVGAPQNRLFELAVRLQKLGVEISVLTAMPNYPQMQIYSGYEGKRYVYEEMQGLKVHRSSIYVSGKKSIVARLRNYFSFVISSARASAKLPAHFDFLMCESPPLFLGYSAMYLARRKRARLIFNVSDLWPESAEKLGVVTNRRLLNMAYRLEAKLYRRSSLVTGQTQGICESIRQRFPSVNTYWLPNGVDLSYYDPSQVQAGEWRRQHGFAGSDFIVVYAGILGLAQGLDTVLLAADLLRSEKDLRFVLVGSGPEREHLLQMKEQLQLNNVTFIDAVTKKEMPSILRSVNAAVIPLKRLNLFLGAIPSKIFECLAMELPLLLGVDGEARELFVERGQCGLYFTPESAQELASATRRLLVQRDLARGMGINGRRFVDQNFNREQIARAFYERLKKL